MRLSIFDEATRDQARNSRVFLDGVDVTNSCQIADDEAGTVLLIVRDEHGRAMINEWHELATEWRTGSVEIRPK